MDQLLALPPPQGLALSHFFPLHASVSPYGPCTALCLLTVFPEEKGTMPSSQMKLHRSNPPHCISFSQACTKPSGRGSRGLREGGWKALGRKNHERMEESLLEAGRICLGRRRRSGPAARRKARTCFRLPLSEILLKTWKK